jgi:hypothetical protein
MVKVKYTGKGMWSRGYKFRQDSYDGIYTVSEEDAKYFLDTFPDSFVLIEKVPKPASKTRSRKTSKASVSKQTEE